MILSKLIASVTALQVIMGGAMAWGKPSGDYLHELTMKYETPHLEWCEDVVAKKELKTLFIVPRVGARDAVEMLQRLPMDFTAYLTQGWNRIADDDSVYEAGVSGTSKYEKTQELLEKLKKNYDLILIAQCSFDALPPDAQLQILYKVKDGTGLMLVGQRVRMPYKKVFAQPLPSPEFVTEIGQGGLPSAIVMEKSIKAYQFGAGRVSLFDYSSGRVNSMLPNIEVGDHYMAEYENSMALLLRGALWTAKKDLPVTVNCPDLASSPTFESSVKNIRFELGGNGAENAKLSIRIRDEYNNVLNSFESDKSSAFSLSLPALPAGKYYCDYAVKAGKKTIDFGFYSFNVSSPLGNLSVNVKDESIAGHAGFGGTVKLEKPAGEALTLCMRLIDSPCGRIWAQREYPLPAGSTEIKWEFSNYHMPTIAGYAEATLRKQNGECLCRSRTLLFFPDYTVEDYIQLGFGIESNPLAIPQMMEKLGFTAGLTHPAPAGANARSSAILNQRFIPYMVRVGLNPGKGGGVKQYSWFFLPKELQDKVKDLNDDECYYRPEVKALWMEGIRYRIQNLPKYGPPIYSLGDENCFKFSAGYGPSDLKYFREFLSKKYGSIEKLNREWKSNYKQFDEVPHPALGEEKKTGNYVAWNDHHEYMEKMFSDIHSDCAAEIKKIDPLAKVGTEGTFGGHDLELTMEKLDYWGPYTSMIEDEVVRCFAKDKIRTVWSGYLNERGEGKSPRILEHLLKGIVNGNGWYSTATDTVHDLLSSDLSPSYPDAFVRQLNKMRFGFAQLMINNPLIDSGVAIYWSHLSRRAINVDKRCVSPESGISPLLRFCYRNGIGFDMVSERTLGRLANGQTKLLFVLGISSLSEKEAAAIKKFVENGGTVFADMNCGILNEYLSARDKNPLSELFGDLVIDKLQEPALMPIDIEKDFNGSKIRMKAEKALVNPGSALFSIRKIGKGVAILANFNFAVAETSAARNTPFDQFLKSLLAGAGISMPYGVESLDENGVIRIRKGAGFDLLGVWGPDKCVANKLKSRIKLPSSKFVYECGKGFLGKKEEINIEFSESPLMLYALFDAKQEAPAARFPASSSPGTATKVDLSSIPQGRTLLLQVFDPKGQELLSRNKVIDTGKSREIPFFFAYNDPVGAYKMLLTDISTGLKQEVSITLK